MDYERKEQILNILRAKHYATVNEICGKLFVSGSTVRRDMKELEETRQIFRTRGGAYLVESISNEDPIAVREQQHVTEKQTITALALQYIHDGMTIFMDSSSTVHILAQNLKGYNNLRIITNSLKTALFLTPNSGMEVLCICGRSRSASLSVVGQDAVDYISKYNADAVFLSACGFDINRGTSEPSEEEAQIKRTMIENAREKYLLCDTSKMGKVFLCKTGDTSEFTKIITEEMRINSQFETPATAN